LKYISGNYIDIYFRPTTSNIVIMLNRRVFAQNEKIWQKWASLWLAKWDNR